GSPGDDANFFPARFRVGVDRRIGPDISEVDRLRENGLYGARPGVVDEPLDGDVWTEALLEPALALARECMRDEALGVRDIGKMADPQNRLSERDCRGRQKEHGRGREATEGCAPSWLRIGGFAFRHDRSSSQFAGGAPHSKDNSSLLICN